jgi:hypothetical protein
MIRRVLLAISLVATLGVAGFGMASTADAHGCRHGGYGGYGGYGGGSYSAFYGNYGGYYPQAYRANYYPSAYYGSAYYGGYGGCRDRGGLYFSIGF